MKWQVQNESHTKKVIDVHVDKETVQKSYNKVFNQFKNNAKVDGYRKGKVPEEMIKNLYKDSIYEEIIRDIVPATYGEIMKEIDLHVVSYPALSDVKFTDDTKEEITYKIAVEVNPEFEVKDYGKMKIDAKKFDGVREDDVEKEVKRLRQYRGTLKAVEKEKVEDGDFAEVSISAFVDNKADASLTSETQLIQIGSKGIIPELDNGIKGMSLGQEKDINVVFPADYFNKKYAGRNSVFKVKVKAIKVLELPDFNDEFAKSMSGFGTADELKKAITDEMTAQAKSDVRQQNIAQVLKKLADENTFEVPAGLVEEEAKNILSRYENALKQQNLNIDQMGVSRGELLERNKKQAEENIKIMYILRKIAEKEGIDVTDADVEAEIRKIAGDMKQDADAMVTKAKGQDNWDALKAKLTEDKVVDKLLEIAGAK
jgi:trigger factor